MVATQRHSNETLAVLQRAVNAGSGSMLRMRSIPTTNPVPAPDAPLPTVAALQADLAALQAEVISVRAERDQLRALLADLQASQVQLRAQLADTQAQLAAVEAERQEMRQELVDLKRKPFTARSQSDHTTPPKPRGRPVGHAGSSRPALTISKRYRQATRAPIAAPPSAGRAPPARAWSKISSWCARPSLPNM